MHHHRSTSFRMAVASVLLAIVIAVETYGLTETGNLVLLTHLADVVGDFTFYGIVFLIALVSWRRDAAGRVHEHDHPEEMFASMINLVILSLGLFTATIAAVANLFHPEKVEDWSAVIGPLASVACYIAIAQIIRNGDRSFSKSLVDAHLLGDLLTSSIVVGVSVLVVGTGWAILNPLGALAVVPVLGIILVRKVGEYRALNGGAVGGS